jgi:hypothetical protein
MGPLGAVPRVLTLLSDLTFRKTFGAGGRQRPRHRRDPGGNLALNPQEIPKRRLPGMPAVTFPCGVLGFSLGELARRAGGQWGRNKG